MPVFFDAVEKAWAAADAHGLQPPARKLVLLAVARYVNGHPGFPAVTTVAGHAGVSPAQAYAHLSALVNEGYLTQTRRKPSRPGWGAPQWELGPRCQEQTSGGPELKPARTLAGKNQTSGGPELQTSGGPEQKRESSTTESGSGETGTGGGETLAGSEESLEERTPQTPRERGAASKSKKSKPAKPTDPAKQDKVAAVCDAVKAVLGKSPYVSGRDGGAINKTSATPQEIADAYLKVVQGKWKPAGQSDGFVAGNLSFWFIIDRLNAIQAGPTNGQPSPRARADLSRHEARMQSRLTTMPTRRTDGQPEPPPSL